VEIIQQRRKKMYVALTMRRIDGTWYYSAMRNDGECIVGEAKNREEVFEKLEEVITLEI
jgi:hypothetical protein